MTTGKPTHDKKHRCPPAHSRQILRSRSRSRPHRTTGRRRSRSLPFTSRSSGDSPPQTAQHTHSTRRNTPKIRSRSRGRLSPNTATLDPTKEAYYDLTGFQRDCLQAIAAVAGEPYGLALKDWLDDRYSEVVKHPRLYHNLDQLEAEGLVTTTDSDTDDARRTVYALTDTGERLLEAYAGEIARLQPQETLVTDGGVDTNSIDPFVCPRGHHSITVNATRFSCQTCYERGHEPSNWDKTALVDLREETPPEADDDRLVSDGGVTPHASAEPGEALYTTTDGGAVAARVHDLELGEATTSVTVGATDIAAAVGTYHHDDYPSVYIQTDGQQLAITDHASPIDGADVPDWEAVDADVVSKPVLTQPDAVVQPLVSRDALRAALDEFAVDAAVTVLVEVDRPVYVIDGDTAVGIAPQVAREALPASGGGVDA